jgi:hypothetical protein
LKEIKKAVPRSSSVQSSAPLARADLVAAARVAVDALATMIERIVDLTTPEANVVPPRA